MDYIVSFRIPANDRTYLETKEKLLCRLDGLTSKISLKAIRSNNLEQNEY